MIDERLDVCAFNGIILPSETTKLKAVSLEDCEYPFMLCGVPQADGNFTRYCQIAPHEPQFGGNRPYWLKDGDTIVYTTKDNPNKQIMTVEQGIFWNKIDRWQRISF